MISASPGMWTKNKKTTQSKFSLTLSHLVMHPPPTPNHAAESAENIGPFLAFFSFTLGLQNKQIWLAPPSEVMLEFQHFTASNANNILLIVQEDRTRSHLAFKRPHFNLMALKKTTTKKTNKQTINQLLYIQQIRK